MRVLNAPANSDRSTALDFICIYGNKCKVLDSNLHGNNEFGFAEFTNKREKIVEAIKLAVKNKEKGGGIGLLNVQSSIKKYDGN